MNAPIALWFQFGHAWRRVTEPCRLASRDMEAQTFSKHGLLKELGALLLFIFVAGMAAMPCLCVTGAIAGQYKLVLFYFVSLRLGWSIYKRSFRFKDFWIYFAIVMAFCLWVELNS